MLTNREIVVTGQAFVGNNQTFNFSDEFVEASPVSTNDLRLCAPDEFADPMAEWLAAPSKLRDHRVVILRGRLGSGRRTAALRLLLDLCEPENIFDLAPAWERPRVSLLTTLQPGRGYVLDMTELSEQSPESEFGTRLLRLARQNSIYMVVTTTDETWTGTWTRGTQPAIVRFASPDARDLITRQLKKEGRDDRLPILTADDFTDIWKSQPKLEDARRLASLIMEPENRPAAQIAAEYGDWRDWINQALPSELDPRILMWSCAFCDGGNQGSILKMGENLHTYLGEKRGDRQILLDPPASKRLESAHIRQIGGRVRLSPDRHGLARAVRRHLWGEYEAQRGTLTRWLREDVRALPLDDAYRVARSMFDLVIRFRDDTLLTALRDTLTGDLKPVAVEVFTKAALDRDFGSHMRNRLYTWLRASPTQELIEVVAEVCGGEFGVRQPDMALRRLRLAAMKSQNESFALGEAFDKLASHYPAKVLEAIDNWYSSPATAKAGVNAFLGLASFEHGASLLCDRTVLPDGSNSKDVVISHFRHAIDDPVSHEAALRVIETWGGVSQRGELNQEITIEILGGALAPYVRSNIMARFPDAINTATYWGSVFEEAIIAFRKASLIAINQRTKKTD